MKKATQRFLSKLYEHTHSHFLRNKILKLTAHFDGGQTHSTTARHILKKFHDIEIGMYSHGGCFNPANFQNQGSIVRIGRYCEFASNFFIANANHPLNLKSIHAFFYEPRFGYSKKDFLTRTNLEMGHDVWIGHNAVILPSVSKIGNGAVIGANTVVHQNVPPFAVVSGFPGRVVRHRFNEETIRQIEESKWWEKPIEELRKNIVEFQRPLDGTESIR